MSRSFLEAVTWTEIKNSKAMNNNNKQNMTRDVTAPRLVTYSYSQITTSNLKKRASLTPLLSQSFSLFLFRYKIVTSQSSPSFWQGQNTQVPLSPELPVKTSGIWTHERVITINRKNQNTSRSERLRLWLKAGLKRGSHAKIVHASHFFWKGIWLSLKLTGWRQRLLNG